jgi:hypothetical protein
MRKQMQDGQFGDFPSSKEIQKEPPAHKSFDFNRDKLKEGTRELQIRARM